MDSLLQNYDWIADEKKYFGQQNTAYDFKANDPKEAERRIQKLTDTKEKLSKSVNMRAMNMLGKAEEQVYRIINCKADIFDLILFISWKEYIHEIKTLTKIQLSYNITFFL